jgi:hypothetical protein
MHLRFGVLILGIVLLPTIAAGTTHAPLKSSSTSSPVSREFSNYQSLNKLPFKEQQSREAVKTYGYETKWQKIEAEAPCRDIVDKMADWFFPFSFSGIVGEGLISCYTRAGEKFLFIKLLMEAASTSHLAEFNAFLAERERVPLYGIKISFKPAWAIVSQSVLKAGTIPGDEDSWFVSRFIQEDRATHVFPNYGAWLSYWYDFLNKSGAGMPELLNAISGEFSPELATYYRASILPVVNGILTMPEATIVYDPASFSKPDGGVFFVHDCRTNPNGLCGAGKKNRTAKK